MKTATSTYCCNSLCIDTIL